VVQEDLTDGPVLVFSGRHVDLVLASSHNHPNAKPSVRQPVALSNRAWFRTF
jgi:hypothetical protein